MDKYEFNVRIEQIKKLVNKADYESAMKIADTIDWRRVRNVSILSMVSSIYEKNVSFSLLAKQKSTGALPPLFKNDLKTPGFRQFRKRD